MTSTTKPSIGELAGLGAIILASIAFAAQLIVLAITIAEESGLGLIPTLTITSAVIMVGVAAAVLVMGRRS